MNAARPTIAFSIKSLLVIAFCFPVIASASVLPTSAAYNATASVLPPNMPSLGFQATQTSEFGDYVHLSAGTGRLLDTVTVTMSNWALASTPANIAFCAANAANCDATGFFWPITLTVYSDALTGGVPNTVLATKTVVQHIPWRPAGDPSCPDTGYGAGFAWKAGDGSCYNGYAFNATFDLSDLNAVLTDKVIIGVAYNTQSYGSTPVSVDGPYNSLNVGVVGAATVGADDNTDNVFWNTSTASNYTDSGVAGVGIFRQDTGWGSPSAYGTIPFAIQTFSKPMVASVSSDGQKYNIASGATVPVKITFDQGISNLPTISVSPDGAAQTVTDCGDADTTIFCFDYAVPAATDKTTETISVSGALDSTGSQAMDADSTHTFTVDTVAPSISSVTSTGNTAALLKIGDAITFTAHVSSVPDAGSSVMSGMYNGHTLTWSTADGGSTYTSTYTITSGDSDQSVPQQVTGVTITDGAGNTGTPVNGTDVTDTIDANRPTLSGVNISSNNANPVYAKTGDTVTLFFSSNENITTPTVTLDGLSIPAVGGPTDWSATHVFAGTETEGLLPFTIDFSDIAGNTGAQKTITDDASSVTYDKTGPIVSSVSTTNADGPYKAGAHIDFTVAFGESVQVSGTPKLALNYNSDSASYLSGSGTNTLTFRYTVQAGDNTIGLNYLSTSALSLSGGTITDLAGNNANLHLPNPATFGHSITLDTIAPSVSEVTPVTTPTNASTYAYTYSTNEAGTASYGGSCSTTAGGAVSGTITVSFAHLADGTYADCTVMVTDAAGNVGTLHVTPFTVDTTPPTATVTTSDTDGVVKHGDVRTITATFNEAIKDAPAPTITIYGADLLAATAMTKTDSTHYTYAYTVAGTGDGTIHLAINGAVDLVTNVQTVPNEVTLTLDNTAPVIATHSDVTGVEATSASGAVVTYTAPNATDAVSGTFAATCAPASGTTFALGNTTVTCNATDAAGNAATPITFTVQVIDTTAPSIAAHGGVTAEATSASGAVVTYTAPNATDAVSGTFAATCAPASGSTFALGNTTVTCNATDAAGNHATATTFSIGVHDTTAPIITLNGSDSVSLTAGTTYTEQGATATDIVDGTDAVTIGGDAVNTGSAGTYHVTYDAVDAAGNHATQVVRTVTVNAAPVAGNGPVSGGGGGGGSAPVALPNNGGAPAGQVLGASTSTVPTSGTTGQTKFVFEHNMSVGSRLSPDVTELQKVLIAEGFLKIEAPTGYFGSLTKAAVVKYQQAHGVQPTSGYVGPLTRAQLNK